MIFSIRGLACILGMALPSLPRCGLTHWASNHANGWEDSVLLRYQFSPDLSMKPVQSQSRLAESIIANDELITKFIKANDL